MPAAKKPAKKPASKSAKKATSAKKSTAKSASAAKKVAAPVKAVKETLSKTGLAAHLSAETGVETKSIKAVLAALESTMMGSVHKRGLRGFTLPGLIKITVQDVPAKKKRWGKDPFTGLEREFAAKPATVRVKARVMKKLKDAAM